MIFTETELKGAFASTSIARKTTRVLRADVLPARVRRARTPSDHRAGECRVSIDAVAPCAACIFSFRLPPRPSSFVALVARSSTSSSICGPRVPATCVTSPSNSPPTITEPFTFRSASPTATKCSRTSRRRAIRLDSSTTPDPRVVCATTTRAWASPGHSRSGEISEKDRQWALLSEIEDDLKRRMTI